MDRVLVDTDVFSFIFKRDSRRQLYEPDLRGKQLCLAFMSFAEVKRWSLQRKWGSARKRRLAEGMAAYIVVPFDAPMADTWAEITVHRERLGHPIACGDCWIAATALRHGISLVTHNGDH